MARSVVALLTDFGTADHYVGTMKGVVLGICPGATLVDITHDVPPQDVVAGAIELAAAFSYFPAGTVFLAVVDPGVGSARRAVAVESGDYRFVGPDNGLLTPAIDRGPSRAVVLSATRYRRAVVSRTFEGRDRFAPAAGWLAAGVPLDELGPPADDLVRLALPQPHEDGEGLVGEVLRVDRFGNLVSNIDEAHLARWSAGRAVRVIAGGTTVEGLVGTYAEVAPGAVCALIGSTGHLEVSVSGGHAAGRLGLGRGARITVLPDRS